MRNENDEIDLLITQLKKLKLRQELILQQEHDVIRHLEAARARKAEREANPNLPRRDIAEQFQPGDRVEVKNRVKKPSNWNRNKPFDIVKERYGTVTRVVPRNRVSEAKVFYKTYNGSETWRIPKNLLIAKRGTDGPPREPYEE